MSSIPPTDSASESPRDMTNPARRGGLSNMLEPMILTWKLFWDGRVSMPLKLIPLAAVVYVISPVDFIPELALPFIGLLDDVGVLILALNVFVALSPQVVVAEYRQQLGFSGAPRDEPDVVDGHAEVVDDR